MNRNRVLMVLALAAAVVLTLGTAVNAAKYEYPEAHKGADVDDFHGTQVSDPYRWLEDPDSDETMKWVDAENAITRKYIDSFSGRDKLQQRMTEIWNYERYSTPYRKGEYYIYTKNDGLQNQSVMYVQKSLDGEARVLIDPNTFSDDGTVALSGTHFSHDGKYVVYGVSKSGSDRQELFIRNVDTGKDFDDHIKWTKFAGVAWKKDKSGFYYNRFPEPGTVPEEDENNYSKIYWHQLGTSQDQDVLVYENKENKEIGYYPAASDDGDFLVLVAYHGTDDRNGVLVRRMDDDGDFTTIIEVGEAAFSPIDNINNTMYFQTELDAPRGRVLAVDFEKPDRANWTEVVPQTDIVLDEVVMVNNQLVMKYMKDAHHVLRIHEKNGEFIRDIELPTVGAVYGVSGNRKDTEMFFAFSSFLFPTTAFRYDFNSDEVAVFRAPEVDFDASGFETKQVFYESKDGTKVPMFITHKKGLELDGTNPTILYGYGGYNIGMTPYFSITRAVWIEQGGVMCVANLRGGNEYGEEWHQGGMLDRKQNTFDDFIAGAEWLIDNQYTSSDRIAIQGGSNGGLLVAACMLQRPDLFGAVLCHVPVTDMLRYHKFTVGRYWIPEYGDPGQSRSLQVSVRLLAASQRQGRRELSADVDPDGRHRRSRRAGARQEVCCRASGQGLGRESDPDSRRDQSRPRRRQADGQTYRGSDGLLRLSLQDLWHDGPRKAVTLVPCPVGGGSPSTGLLRANQIRCKNLGENATHSVDPTWGGVRRAGTRRQCLQKLRKPVLSGRRRIDDTNRS